MAYNTRLTVDFYEWRFSNRFRVEIKEDGYAGGSSTMLLSGNPVQIRKVGTEDIFQLIHGTEATINLIQTPSDDYSFLFTENERKYQVIISLVDSGTLALTTVWAGWLNTGQQTIGFKAWNVITLKCNDGIQILEDKPYLDESTGIPYDGFATMRGVLVNVLAKTGLDLNIVSMVNIVPTEYFPIADTSDTLGLTYIQQNRFQDSELNPVSCMTVLKSILTSLAGAKIIQCMGKWHIIRSVEQYDATIKYREYTSDGVYVANGTYSIRRTLTDGHGSPLFVALGISDLSILPGYRSIQVIQDFGLRKSIFPGYNFPENEFTTMTSLRHFTLSGSSLWTGLKVGDDYVIKCLDGTNPNDYIQSNPIEVLQGNANENLKLVLKCGAIGNTANTYVALRLYTGAVYYYWDGSAWVNNGGSDPGVSGTFRIQFPKSTADLPQTIDPIIIDPIPADGQLSIRFYDYQQTLSTGNPFISEILLTAQFNDQDWLWYTETNNSLIDADNSKVPEPVRMLFNDSTGLNSGFAFADGIMLHDPSTTPVETTEWLMRDSVVGGYRMRKWIAQIYIDQNQPYKFDTTIIGEFFKFYESLVIPVLGSKIFIPDDVTVDLKHSTITGSFIQVKDTTETIVLTETYDNSANPSSIITGEDTDSYFQSGDSAAPIGTDITFSLIDETGALEIDIDNDYAVTGITIYSAAGAMVKVGWSVGTDNILRQKTVSGANRIGYSMFNPTPTNETTVHVTITGTASVYILMTKYK